MAIPAVNSVNGPRDPQFSEIMRQLAEIRLRTQRLIDQTAAGPTSIVFIMEKYYAYLVGRRDELEVLVALPGMGAYASGEFQGTGINIAVEWGLTRNAINDVIAWIQANAPLTNLYTYSGDNLVLTTVSSAATAGLRTELAKITAQIEPPV